MPHILRERIRHFSGEELLMLVISTKREYRKFVNRELDRRAGERRRFESMMSISAVSRRTAA